MTTTRARAAGGHTDTTASLEWLAAPLEPRALVGRVSRAVKLTALALISPGIARLVSALVAGEAFTAGALFGWFAPGAMAAAFLWWVNREGARRELARLRKETRLPSAFAAFGSLMIAGASALPGGAGALFAQIASLLIVPLLGVVTFAESDHGTLEQWLMQPLARWRLYAEKLLVVLLLGGVAIAQIMSSGAQTLSPPGLCSGLAIALGLGPVLALTLRGWLNAVAITLMASFGAYFMTVPPELQGVVGATLGGTAQQVENGLAVSAGAVPLLCAALGVLPWLGLAWSRNVSALPRFTHRRWWRVTGRTAFGTLVRKEARMQLPVAGLMVPAALLWLNAVLSDRRGDIGVIAVAFFGGLGALLAGTIPVTSEHEYGTFSSEAAVVPARAAWRVKVGVSLASAVLVAVVIPALLYKLTPGLLALRDEVTVGGSWVDPERESLRAVAKTFLAWLGVAMLAWSSGLLSSTLSRRMTSAFVTALGIVGASVVLMMGLAFPVGMQLGWALFGHIAEVSIAAPLHAVAAGIFCVLPTAALLRLAKRASIEGRPGVAGWLTLALAMIASGLAGGLAVP